MSINIILKWIMIIFVFLCVYVIHILSLNYSEGNIPKRKPTVQSQEKVNILKVRLSDGV